MFTVIKDMLKTNVVLLSKDETAGALLRRQ
jgi:hypothetical protein